MSQSLELNRRAFLKSAGVTAVLGAVGAKPASATIGTNGGPPTLLYATHDFDEVFDRVGTDCSKWDSPIATYGEDIKVAMGIADMDFRTAPCVTKALAERCAHENWGYLRRPESYIQSIVDWNKRRYDLDVDPSAVALTTGVHAGLIAALQTFAPPGSRVLLTAPVYSGFYSDLRFTRTVPEDSPMRLVDGCYSIDFEDFERRARRTNAFILCNPQNPTGNLWSAEDMTRMGEICLEHRVVMLVDEIHCDFVSSGEQYIPFASLPNREIVNNSITFKSATKSFSLSRHEGGLVLLEQPRLHREGEGEHQSGHQHTRHGRDAGRPDRGGRMAGRVERVPRRQPRVRRNLYQGADAAREVHQGPGNLLGLGGRQ